MKNTLICFILTGIIYSFSSCEKLKIGGDFLTNPPDATTVNKDTVFSDIKYAERFLWDAYVTLPWGITGNIFGNNYLEMMTDLVSTSYSKTNACYSGTYSSTSENSPDGGKYYYYGSGWSGIRKCLIFIANIGRVPNTDKAYKRQLIAEAWAIIATHYSIMYRHYGGLTWINQDLPVTTIGQFPRLTSLATMDSIVALCDRAVPDLPWVIADQVNWSGRFTKAGIMGIKARTLLFGASPLFNSATPYREGEAATQKLTWHGSYNANLWVKARDAAKALIAKVESEGAYAINTSTGNSRLDFRNAYITRGYGETLISTRRDYQYPGSDYSYVLWFQGKSTWNQEYVDMFPMASGQEITDAVSGYDPTNPYINRDPRLYETVLTNGDTFRGRIAELWIGGRERLNSSDWPTGTGYGPRKFYLDDTNLQGQVEQWPLLRLAEIYLSYAEAENEVNNGPDAEAYRCVNKIRNRVGLSNLPSGLSKENFRAAVLKERACEFGLEEVRWFDIVRWKRDDIFKKPFHGMDITKNFTTGKLTYTLFPLWARYWQSNWDTKWYLSAFPLKEIQKGYGLVQNPGWEN
ncbi:MAG: RagB/SusD family nutrient uptake outer membrane protein [Prolixibacteraceae bacterium]|jgi:hypothetical protein|nr:RagB/SusD family nutrient uptake outer membrane protein [Prolixibacteraceae bacterium]